MNNPISARARGILYLLGIIVGSLAVITGPLILALQVPEVWGAVIVSAVGAIVSLLSLLARDNLPTLDEDDVYIGKYRKD